MNNKKNTLILGSSGMVGSAIVRKLQNSKNTLLTPSHKQLDLINQKQVFEFFGDNKVDEIYLCAGKVGGISANSNFPMDFLYENLMIQTNVLHAAFRNNIPKLIFIGSSSIYPKDAPMPFKEESLLSGALEKSNEAYAIAKIAGIKFCEYANNIFSKSRKQYLTLMPANLYGISDDYDPSNGHVIASMISKMHNAKINSKDLILWGTGSAYREFLNVDDLSNACVLIMNKKFQELKELPFSHINVGSGVEISIKSLAEILSNIIGYSGDIIFDHSKPDGMKRKIIDSSIMKSLGWEASVELVEGLEQAYQDFLKRDI